MLKLTLVLLGVSACLAYPGETEVEARGALLGGGIGGGPGYVGGVGHGVGYGGGYGGVGGFGAGYGHQAGGSQGGFQAGAAGHKQGSGGFASGNEYKNTQGYSNSAGHRNSQGFSSSSNNQYGNRATTRVQRASTPGAAGISGLLRLSRLRHTGVLASGHGRLATKRTKRGWAPPLESKSKI
uniref:Putative conserved secreted protein n=1 Tax=Ixodes scapularis TaxID=6945 RepID=A0A4D5S528_IXOSC